MPREDDYDRKVAKFDRANITEDSLALTFCAAHPALRYVAAWNRWMAWEGVVWSEDSTLAVYDLVRAHIRQCTDETKMLRANVVAAVEKMSRSDRRYAAVVDQWDADDWVLNTPGGIVDLRTGDARPNEKDAYLSKVTAVAPGGECPRWLQFLSEVTAGDADYQSFLQRVAGYTALGTIREHSMFFSYGLGANGKGVFLNTLHKVMGDYSTVASMDTFTESKTDRHPTDLAMLRGARLVIAQETEEGRAWAESRMKALTGGDPISARRMRQDFFTFEPSFKLFIAGNHKPRLRNVDEAMRRRLYLLPFTQTFKGSARDPDLTEKLISEAGGILRWVVDGSLAYQREGLKPPAVVLDATAEYFSEENLFGQWVEECCELHSGYWERPATLFNSWKKYADHANDRIGSQKTFGEKLTSAGFLSGNSRGRGGRYWEGLRVAQTPPESWER